MTLYDIYTSSEHFIACDGDLSVYIDTGDYASDDYYHQAMETRIAEAVLKDIPAVRGDPVRCEFKDYMKRHDGMFKKAMEYAGIEDTPENRLYLLLGIINGCADDEIYHMAEVEYS